MTVQAVLDAVRRLPGTGDVIPVFDPATEEQITEFTDSGTDAVNDAVARAKSTAESGVWSGLPDYERAKVLWRVGELIDTNAELLAELEMLNAGRCRWARNGSATTPAGAPRSTASRAT
jgi:phenylacetaldehyde dehydrogenase